METQKNNIKTGAKPATVVATEQLQAFTLPNGKIIHVLATDASEIEQAIYEQKRDCEIAVKCKEKVYDLYEAQNEEIARLQSELSAFSESKQTETILFECDYELTEKKRFEMDINKLSESFDDISMYREVNNPFLDMYIDFQELFKSAVVIGHFDSSHLLEKAVCCESIGTLLLKMSMAVKPI